MSAGELTRYFVLVAFETSSNLLWEIILNIDKCNYEMVEQFWNLV